MATFGQLPVELQQVTKGTDTYFLVSGSRDWGDKHVIEAALQGIDLSWVLVHGNCRGADKIADRIWRKLGGRTLPCPADWQRGKHAGLQRNELMLKDYQITKAFCFCKNNSRGTVHMISLLRKAGVPIEVHDQNDDC